jgi:ribonuclease HI
VTVACDGAARGNPGPAGIGVVIVRDDGEVLATIAEGIGEATNNVAEYTAAIEGLRRAADLGASDVLLRSDSRLLIEQLAGRFKVRNERLRALHTSAMKVAGRFSTIRFEHVPRERNRDADRLANEGVDDWLAAGRPSRRARWLDAPGG